MWPSIKMLDLHCFELAKKLYFNLEIQITLFF